MLLDSLLLYLHISAVLGLVVFLTAKVALMRPEVLDGRPALTARLLRLDLWCWGGFAAVALSGALVVLFGAKGTTWYVSNPLLGVKVALFVAMAVMGVPSSRALRGWRDAGVVPDPAAIKSQRRWLMWQAHVLVLLPLFGVLLAHGF